MGSKDELEIWGTQESEALPLPSGSRCAQAACKKIPRSSIPSIAGDPGICTAERSIRTTSVMGNCVKVFAVGAASREEGLTIAAASQKVTGNHEKGNFRDIVGVEARLRWAEE